MIRLKTLLDEHGITSAQFLKRFRETTAECMSKTSFSLLLSQGKELKKMPDFKEKIAKVFNSLTKQNINCNELFKEENAQEDKMIECANLNQEILTHFGLKKDPFPPYLTKESDIVMLDSHYYALEMMRAARETGQFTVIIGEVGAGKTTVLGKFIEETKAKNDCLIAKVRTKDFERCTTKDILRTCIFDLSDERPKRDNETLSRQVEQLLIKHNNAGKRVVLIIDDAQDIHTHTLKFLKRLWELRDGLIPLIGIIMIGQPELGTRLYRKENLAVREIAARTMPAYLTPINSDLQKYLDAKITKANGKLDKIITDDGIAALSHKLTIEDANGKITYNAYPLNVGNQMKRLMILAYEQGLRVIDTHFINEVGI